MSIFGQPRIRNGQILFCGEDISHKSTHYVASGGIAQAPEGRRIFPDMTVEENLLMGTIPVGNQFAADDMQSMFELFPRLKERRKQRAMTMSGGEQQMLAIARALMSRPKLLLLDEPSLGLAPIVVKQIFQTLRELARNGMTIFLVEQNAHHALKLSDRGYVMVNGQRPQRQRRGVAGKPGGKKSLFRRSVIHTRVIRMSRITVNICQAIRRG